MFLKPLGRTSAARKWIATLANDENELNKNNGEKFAVSSLAFMSATNSILSAYSARKLN